ncbi:HFL328Cp [Eremothecium sinecaudum]|uniref:histidinol-phosphate transaminase n=1 Tax=Eremothecium sinecaudum TaxID=45286 RepID=A0A109UZY9_9SACH|nr:HFL328Cp [Eremothecium sinecaudum]AMD21528.1 HFL328Cp [Eremothecium sinecaudum]
MTFNLSVVIRPNILTLQPYVCARDDFSEGILLDANENAFGPNIADVKEGSSLHRYPDPRQNELKSLMAKYRNETSGLNQDGIAPLKPENFCLGVGSDESIDLLIRATCIPGKDKILLLPPTYGMYSVCAALNDVECVRCALETADNFYQVNVEKILEILNADSSIKLVFITSPGNPTGACIETSQIEQILNGWTNGLVVVDEAYIDFASPSRSAALLANKYPNVAVLQTLSKSFGLAGIRLGFTITSCDIARILNNMKAPYNISTVTSELATKALQPENIVMMESNVRKINTEKLRVLKALTALENVEDQHVGGLDANFLLLRLKTCDNVVAKKLCINLATKSGVVIRYRGGEHGCQGCVRITIGTKEENDIMIEEFSRRLAELVE